MSKKTELKQFVETAPSTTDRVLDRDIELYSGVDLPGEMATMDELASMPNISSAFVGPKALEIASSALANFNQFAALAPQYEGEMADMPRGQENTKAYGYDLSDQESLNLPAIITNELMHADENLTTRVKWRGLSSGVRRQSNVGTIQSADPRAISGFLSTWLPCFRNLASRSRSAAEAVGNINTLVRMENAGEEFNSKKEEIDAVMKWILENGMVVEGGALEMPDIMPGYKANVILAFDEGTTYVAVQEKAGDASYTYNRETGELVITPMEGVRINPGDVLAELSLNELEDGVDFAPVDIESDVVLRSIGDRKYELVYSGDGVFSNTDSVVCNVSFHNNMTFENYVSDDIDTVFSPMGAFCGADGGTAPMNARYIYAIKGCGRQYYLNNPNSMKSLEGLFKSDLKITIPTQNPVEQTLMIEKENLVQILMRRHDMSVGFHSGVSLPAVSFPSDEGDWIVFSPQSPDINVANDVTIMNEGTGSSVSIARVELEELATKCTSTELSAHFEQLLSDSNTFKSSPQ